MRKALYILSDLADEDIIWMARNGRVRRLGAGEALIEAGVATDQLYFVLDGRLQVVSRSGAHLSELGQGDVAGEMSFVEKRLPGASVRALSPVDLLGIPRAAMLVAFEANPGMAMRFYRALAMFLSDRLRSASDPNDAELDELLLDGMQQAGERFIRLVDMVRTVPA